MQTKKPLFPKVKVQAEQQVEAHQIQRFATAIGALDPAHHDASQARRLGFRDLVAPPTFAATLEPLAALSAKLGIVHDHLTLVEQRLEFQRPLCAGEEVVLQCRLAESREKVLPNGRVYFLTIETLARNRRKQPLFKSVRTMVYTLPRT